MMDVKNVLYDYLEEIKKFLVGNRTISELKNIVCEFQYFVDVIPKEINNIECPKLITSCDLFDYCYIKLKTWDKMQEILNNYCQNGRAYFFEDNDFSFSVSLNDMQNISGAIVKTYRYDNLAVEVEYNKQYLFVPYCLIEEVIKENADK